MDDADAQVILRAVVCRAGAVRRRICRRLPQRQGDVHHQPCQNYRLPDDVLQRASAAGVCGGWVRRGRVLARQVRHPDRIAAA